MKHLFKSALFLPVLIYISALISKLLIINHIPVYSDEITWMVRGKEFLYSIIHLNFNYFENAWWADTNQTEAISIPLSIINGLFHIIFAGASQFSLNILSDILASRLSLVITTSFIPVAIYFFTDKFLNRRTALLATFLYIVNPVVVGIDVMVMNDSLLSLFSFLTIFTFLYKYKNKKSSLWPGFFLGLSFLTKPNGIVPIIALLTVYTIDKSRFSFKLLLSNMASFFVTTIIFWPASWTSPILSVFEYVFRQYSLVKVGIQYFFLGEVTNNPDAIFYFFQIATRLNEITVLGVVLASLFFVRGKVFKYLKNNVYFWGIAAYFITFFILISISNQKLGIRYAAPLIPYICIIAAWGYEKLLIKYKKLGKFLMILILSLSLVPLITFFPNYYLYYNNIIGGPKGAQRYDMVGLCSSTKESFEYLNSIKAEGTVFVAGCPAASNYYSSLQVTNDFINSNFIIVETYHKLQIPGHPVYKFLEGKTPILEVEVEGALISKVYSNSENQIDKKDD